MLIKCPLLEGVVGVLGRGGGEVPILFLWARGFFRVRSGQDQDLRNTRRPVHFKLGDHDR